MRFWPSNGEDQRPWPLIERWAILVELLLSVAPSIQLTEHETRNRRDVPYPSGYVEIWLMVKCTKTESFAVIGYEAVGAGSCRFGSPT